MGMSILTFDRSFESAVGISSVLMVLSATWIVFILINIEKTKTVAFSSALDEDDEDMEDGGGKGTNDLSFEESTTSSTSKHLEVEKADGSSSSGDKPASTQSPTRRSELGVVRPPSSPGKKTRKRKFRRVSMTFVAIQIVSVLVLALLTYLLLVASAAPIALRMLGSICVFGIFLRFQIGEELRRQRIDRLILLLGLFLVVASSLSVITFGYKSLRQGEIYEGPARIVGYDLQSYNNTRHDPTTRADIAVSWGKSWGCPLSGGKVCQAKIKGAMCQVHPEDSQTKHKPNYDNRRRRRKTRRNRSLEGGENDGKTKDDGKTNDESKKEDDSKKKSEDKTKKEEEVEEEEEEEEEEVVELEEDLEDEEDYDEVLEEDVEIEEESNNELKAENEELKEEIAELKEENEIQADEEADEVNEIVDEYDEDIMIVEEAEYEDAQDYEDTEIEQDEEKLEDEIAEATDDGVKEDLKEEVSEDEGTKESLDEIYEEDEEILDEYADEYGEEEEEDAELLEEDTEDEEVVEEEVDETEEEISEIEEGTSMGQGYEDDEWYWDEYPDSYDDDIYEDEYWSYDWDSVWGQYGCEDLFDGDISGKTYDPETPAGGDDEWPFVNIYGSCKTCEAYILDYFAEEAFESVEEYKKQAIIYAVLAAAGLFWSAIAYIKYRVMPTAENELDLLGFDGGVMA